MGSLCQYILHGIDIAINSSGSCHGNVRLLGHPELMLQHSGEDISHEMVWIKKLQVDTNQVIVTHARNLFSLKDKFDKVVYIDFSESDIASMSNKYESKNYFTAIPEANYNAIKDPSWPAYDIFLQGLAPAYVYDEIKQKQTISLYHDWVWILPALEKIHRIHKIAFSDLFGKNDQWIVDLAAYLGTPGHSYKLDYIKNTWESYKNLQL